MLETISWFVIAIITYVADCVVFGKFIGKRFKVSVNNILLIVIASLINCYFINNYESTVRMIVTNLELAILLKIIYNKSIVKSLIATLFIYLGYAVSEMVFVVIFNFILKIDLDFINTSWGALISNVAIIAIFLALSNLELYIKTVKRIMNCYKDNELINNVLLITIAFITFFALTYPISIKAKFDLETITYILVFICTIVFVSGFFREKTRSDELSVEYDHLLNYVKVYEKEVNEKSKSHHEYKNQLIIIRDMLKDKNKKAQKYISDLLEDSFSETDENLLKNLQYIPDGGLKGLIYFKLSALKEKKCQVHVLVDQILENKKLWKTCLDNLVDVSKIIGVFLDNAIEALEEEKEKYLIIDVEYEDKNLIFKISNSCTKHIESNKLDVEGYSTKGSKHGYGLPLVKDIVNNNPLLSNKREQNGKFFVQYLYIKQKK